MQTADARRSAYDPDELEEEQRERERRKRINLDFKRFVRRVQDSWDKDFPRLKLEWDTPYRCAPTLPPRSACTCGHEIVFTAQLRGSGCQR